MKQILDKVNEIAEVLNDTNGVTNVEWVKNNVNELQKIVKEKCNLPVVTTRLFFFDCWKRDGILDCKEIEATCEEHATLKFEKEFGEDYAYDPPYC